MAEVVDQNVAIIDQASVGEELDPIPTGFDIFVLLLSILSLSNIALILLVNDPDILNVVLIVDSVTCLVLLADFALRLHRAPSKRRYVIKERGWLDLLGSLPVPGLRLARLYRVFQVSQSVRRHGARGITESAVANRAGNSLLVAMFLTIIVLEYGSMAILGAEQDAEGSNIQSASDALWWSYVTITTVGYGDRYPVTNLGRNIGVGVLTLGIGLFSVLTGFLANLFLRQRRVERDKKEESAPDLQLELDELRRMILELRVLVAHASEGATHSTTTPDHVSPSAHIRGRNAHDRT